MHHLIDEALPGNQIPRVFIDTHLEYASVLKHVLDMAQEDKRIIVISPKMNLQSIWTEYGYPMKSKEHSCKLHMYQDKGTETKSVQKYLGIYPGQEGTSFQCPKILRYQFTPEFTLKVSDRCCYKLKKEPAHRYEKESGRHCAILGLRSAEGGQRRNHTGCVVLDGDKIKKFKPLNPVSDDWVKWYREKRNIKLPDVYGEPYNLKRTGCKGCPYSPDLQAQLDMMEKYLPLEKLQCEALWKPVYAEYRRIGYRLRKAEDGNE